MNPPLRCEVPSPNCTECRHLRPCCIVPCCMSTTHWIRPPCCSCRPQKGTQNCLTQNTQWLCCRHQPQWTQLLFLQWIPPWQLRHNTCFCWTKGQEKTWCCCRKQYQKQKTKNQKPETEKKKKKKKEKGKKQKKKGIQARKKIREPRVPWTLLQGTYQGTYGSLRPSLNYVVFC